MCQMQFCITDEHSAWERGLLQMKWPFNNGKFNTFSGCRWKRHWRRQTQQYYTSYFTTTGDIFLEKRKPLKINTQAPNGKRSATMAVVIVIIFCVFLLSISLIKRLHLLSDALFCMEWFLFFASTKIWINAHFHTPKIFIKSTLFLLVLFFV